MKNDKLLNNLYMHVRWHLLTSSKSQLRNHGIDDVLVSTPNENFLSVELFSLLLVSLLH